MRPGSRIGTARGRTRPGADVEVTSSSRHRTDDFEQLTDESLKFAP
jgi:hypothetical protein